MYHDTLCTEHFRSMSLFIGGNVRAAVNAGHADCVPIFLHEIPRLFKEGYIKPDIALIHVSPPDEHGFCSFGTSVDCVRSAVSNSKYIVGKFYKSSLFSCRWNPDGGTSEFKSAFRSAGEQTHAEDLRRCYHPFQPHRLRRGASREAPGPPAESAVEGRAGDRRQHR